MKAPNTRKSIIRRSGHAFYRGLRSILVIRDSPHRIAWGVAIGTFVAYLPIVGIQMVIGALLCKIMRANILASIPMAWITNPLTIVPIYYLLYVFGGLFTNDSMTYAEMEIIVGSINEAGVFTWNGLTITIDLFGNIFWPILIGGVIVGLVNGALFYAIVLKIVSVYQLRRSNRRAGWRKKTEQGQDTDVNQETPEPNP